MTETPLRLALASIEHSFPLEDCMSILAELTKADRYQASVGIETAADLVASQAEQAGLREVQIVQLPTDGARHWWTFRAPRLWTPSSATLEVAGEVLAEYPKEACCLATYSAPTPPEGVVAPLTLYDSGGSDHNLSGAIAVIPRSAGPLAAVIRRLERNGAVGFATDAPSRNVDGIDYAGRIELDLDSTIFGFSLRPAAAGRLLDWSRIGVRARAVVRIGRCGSAPLVTGVLPGSSDEEVLLMAHLCHPRPGANDNASGDVALLGLVASLKRMMGSAYGTRRIRFLWGPEFVGMAAFLHAAIHQRKFRLPLCALNLDMVGEDPERCGGSMIVEHAPPSSPSPLNALTDRCAEIIAENACSVSGANAAQPWRWQTTPFRGRSDHLLLADRSISVPAIELSHWPDHFNHSAGDTPDKVDPRELLRSASIAGAVAITVAYLNHADDEWLSPLVAVAEARQLSNFVKRHGAPGPAMTGTHEVHPSYHDAYVAAQASLRAVTALLPGPPSSRIGRLSHWLARQAQQIAAGIGAPELMAEPPREHASRHIRKRWDGPFNPRALLESLTGPSGAWLETEILTSPASTYSRLVSAALAIDDKSSRDQVVRRAANFMDSTIDATSVSRIIDALIESGWADESGDDPGLGKENGETVPASQSRGVNGKSQL